MGSERFKAPEILFNPELIGLEYAGIHQVVVDSINRTDLDLRKNLFANVVLSGGSTLYKGNFSFFFIFLFFFNILNMKINLFLFFVFVFV